MRGPRWILGMVTAVGVAWAAPVGVAQAVPEGVPRADPEGVPRAVPEGVAWADPEGVPRAVPEGVAWADPEGVPRAVPEGVAWADPEGAAVAALRVKGLSCTAKPGFVARCTWKATTGHGVRYQLNWARPTGRAGVRATRETSLHLGPGAGGTYQYRVRAAVGGTHGPYSPWVSVSMRPPVTSVSDGVSDARRVSYGPHVRQRYHALLPPTTAGRRRAVVVLHGGYWLGGSATGRSFGLNQQLYAEGIPSFALEYRFSTDAPWPAQRDDVLAALASIRARAVRFGIDPDRVSLIGMSAGGHLALSAASYGEGASRVASVVTYSAPVDVQLLRGDAPEVTDESTPDDQRRARLADAVNTLIRDDSDSCGALCRTATQPFTASAGDAPALLFASELEWVNPLNSWHYAEAYDRFPGVDVRVHELVGDSRHSIDYVDDDWGDVWAETLGWIREHG